MKAALPLLLLSSLATAQEPGWHYSPYPGEGDRASMGCAQGSTPAAFICVVVRCEDDYSVAVYIDTSRTRGDAGEWILSVDDANPLLVAEEVEGSPYGARVRETATTIASLVELLKHGSVAYLEPVGEPPVVSAAIPMSGSFYAINQALYFCAPRVTPDEGSSEP